MVAPSRVRPLTFFGRVPKGTTNVELVKALVERFSENDLKCVQDFGAGNFEVTFRSKVAVDRFLADSATIKVKEQDIRFEYRGLRTVSVRIYEYPVDASDQVLARVLKIYGNVLSISVDSVPGFKSVSTGNRRARMEMREAVPNILDIEGHTVRCEYDGVVRLCRRCRHAGHEKAKCDTPRCERCEQWGHPSCSAPCKRCGGDHNLRLCKQRLYSEATMRSSQPLVQPPSTDSARVEDAPRPQGSENVGTQGHEKQSAPKAVEVQQPSGENESEQVETHPTASQKQAQSAEVTLQAPGAAEVQEERPQRGLELAEAPASTTSEKATPCEASSPTSDAETSPSAPVVKGQGRASRRRKRGGSRARGAAAARERSSSQSESSDSEGDSPEYKRHAVTAEDDDSSSTVTSDSQTGMRNDVPCSFCGSVGCDCSVLSGRSYPSTPASPAEGEPAA